MNDVRSSWNNVLRIAEEIEPRIRGGGGDARDRWYALQPRFAEVARLIAGSGEYTRILATRKLATLNAMLLRLRDDLVYAHS
jgi:hypothetical protein